MAKNNDFRQSIKYDSSSNQKRRTIRKPHKRNDYKRFHEINGKRIGEIFATLSLIGVIGIGTTHAISKNINDLSNEHNTGVQNDLSQTTHTSPNISEDTVNEFYSFKQEVDEYVHHYDQSDPHHGEIDDNHKYLVSSAESMALDVIHEKIGNIVGIPKENVSISVIDINTYSINYTDNSGNSHSITIDSKNHNLPAENTFYLLKEIELLQREYYDENAIYSKKDLETITEKIDIFMNTQMVIHDDSITEIHPVEVKDISDNER